MGSGNSGYRIGNPRSFTSGQLDNGYLGGTAEQHSIRDNLSKVAETYEFSNGYFGKQSAQGRVPRTRNIESMDPKHTALDFYSRLANGGKEEPLKNGKGVATKLLDGTVITFRKISSSDGSPVVEVNIKKSKDSAGIKKQKIHFIQKG